MIFNSESKSLGLLHFYNHTGALCPALVEIKRTGEDAINLDLYRMDRMDVVLEVDRYTGRLMEVSELAHVVFGVSPEDLKSTSITELVPDGFKEGEPEELLGNR